MPFGLIGAPATYQRLVQGILGDNHLTICCIFIDDIIIFSRTFKEHSERLHLVFDRIRSSYLKLSPRKRQFFKTNDKHVGHIVETDLEKKEKVRNWPKPSTRKESEDLLDLQVITRHIFKILAVLSNLLQI